MSTSAARKARVSGQRAANAAAGGGAAYPITSVSYTTAYNVRLVPPVPGARGSIVQGNGADWFGPLNPMTPTAPPEVAGRRFDIPSGYNLQTRPRPMEIDFAQLRGFADAYDLCRLVIETRKDQMARQKWSIRPRDEETKLEGALLQRAKDLEAFWRRPDRRNFWPSWLRLVLEDLLVIDAPTLHRRRTNGGDLHSLDVIDGGTIAVKVDDWGRTPEYPAPAYQQVLVGLPAIDYTERDLIYRPRNIRSHKVYGYSPVEQIIMTVSIGIKRQIWQLQYFTDGNIPDSLIGVPQTWTPDQIRNFQDDFDSMLEGNTAARRRARFVPGEVAKSYVPTKDNEMFGAAEEWLARVCCAAFGISPTPYIKAMNRATAESSVEEAVIDGLAPIMNWVKELVDTILIEEFAEEELEFAWVEDKEIDPKVQSEILTSYAQDGILTINGARQKLGEDPYEDEFYNRPMVKTVAGWVPISLDDVIADAKRKMEEIPPPPGLEGAAVGPDGKPVPPPPGKKPGATDDEGSDRAAEGATGAAPPKGGKAAVPALRLVADDCPVHVAKGRTLPRPIDAERALTRRARSSMKKTVAATLRRTGKLVSAQVRTLLEDHDVAKADAPDLPEGHGADLSAAAVSDAVVTQTVEEILSKIDLSSLSVMVGEVADDLLDVAGDSALRALAQVGARETPDLVNRVSERSVKFANQRAAELVGKRRLADGTLVDNPSARWAIDEPTRDMLRADITRGLEDNIGRDAIADLIEENYAFSPERAEAIAKTEVARANSEGVLDGYRDARDMGIGLKKKWLTVGDDDVDPEICEANEEDGAIDLDDAFSSGDDAPPGHPNCRCVLIAVVDGEDAGEQGDE